MSHAIVPAMFLACGWSLKNKPKAGVWVAPSGARTTGDCRYSVPYGLDRLIVLYLATQAATHGRVIRGALHDICGMFGITMSESVALTRLRRVVHCFYELNRAGLESDELSHRIPIAERFSWCARTQEFRIVLSEEFARDAAHGAPFSLDVARQLGQAELNLYLLLAMRLHRGQLDAIALLGEGGAYATLPGAANPSTLRQSVKLYMRAICRAWPACPYWVSPDGNTLLYAPRAAQHHEATAEDAAPTPSLENAGNAVTSVLPSTNGQEPLDIQESPEPTRAAVPRPLPISYSPAALACSRSSHHARTTPDLVTMTNTAWVT